mgnify:CR=1 FL=1
MKKEELLIERLKKYRKSDMYPFHMPGHKRAKGIKLSFPDPFSVDITEIDGFDNLHHAEGILKDSMEWASCLYGSDRTWYLVTDQFRAKILNYYKGDREQWMQK